MILPASPSPARAQWSGWLRVELVYACFAASLLYSAVAWVVPFREAQRYLQSAPVSGIRSLLFHTSGGLDFYHVQRSGTSLWQDTDIFTVADAPPDILEKRYDDPELVRVPFDALYEHYQTQTGITYVRESVRLTSSRDFLVQEGTDVRLYRTDQERPYDILHEDGVSMVMLDENRLKLLYARHDDGYRLHVRYPACATDKYFPLGERDGRALDTVRDAGLLPAKALRLSPLQDTAVALDHDWFGTVRVANLITGDVKALRVPTLGDAQVHFDPTYLDNATIAFSVLDGTRGMTMLYRIPDDDYVVLSEAFSDRIIPSQRGTTVLVQTAFDGVGNIPFGSVALIARTPSVPQPDIRRIFPDDSSWTTFFTDPNAPLLTFRSDLTAEVFEGITDPARRTALVALWRQRTGNGTRQGHHRLVEMDGTRAVQERIVPFDAEPAGGLYPYDRSISPLLELLNVPSHIRALYRSTATDSEQRGIPYRLLDVL